MKNPDLATKEAPRGTPFWDHFGRTFLKYFYIDLVGAKLVLRKGASNIELNFAPKAQFFLSLDWKVPS